MKASRFSTFGVLLVIASLFACRSREMPSTACTATANCFPDERCCYGVCMKIGPCGNDGGSDAGADGGADASTDSGAEVDAGSDAGGEAGVGVAISCATPIRLGNGNLSWPFPRLAVDSAGTAFVIWLESSGNVDRLWVSSFVDGGKSSPLALSTDAGAALGAAIAAGPAGRAVAAWVDSRESGALQSVHAAEATLGVWSSPVDIADGGAPNIPMSSPSVAVDPGGNGLATWLRGSGSSDVWANRFSSAGAAWLGVEALESGRDGGAVAPAVAFHGTGNAFVVWGRNESQPAIKSVRLVDGGTWAPIQSLATANAETLMALALAVAPNGNAYVAWTAADGSVTNAWTTRNRDPNGWSDAGRLETDDVNAAQGVRVAASPQGDAIAVWTQSDAVWAQPYSVSSLAWGNSFVAVAEDGGKQDPVAAMADGGRATIAWSQGGNVWIARATSPSGPFGAPVRVSTTLSDAGIASSPQVASSPNGVTSVVWQQWVSTYNVYVSTCN